MKNINWIIGIVSTLVVVGGLFIFSQNNKPTTYDIPADTYLYFWGNGCPHCANVAKFMETWDKKDKIKIQKFEVWYDRNNANLMQEKSKACNVKPSDMAVPLLITPDGKCFMGDTPIIDLFKSVN